MAQIVGLLYPVVLGHLAPKPADYRDVVLAQLAFALNHERNDMTHTIVNPEGLHDPVPFGYSHTAAVPAGAELVLVSGQYGSGADGMVVSTDFAEQVQQAFRNLGVALAAHDLDLTDVVQLRTYVVSPDFEKLGIIGQAVGRRQRRHPAHPDRHRRRGPGHARHPVRSRSGRRAPLTHRKSRVAAPSRRGLGSAGGAAPGRAPRRRCGSGRGAGDGRSR